MINRIIQYTIQGLLFVILIAIILLILFFSRYNGDIFENPFLTFLGLLLTMLGLGFGLFKLLGIFERPILITQLTNYNNSTSWIKTRIKTDDIKIESRPYYSDRPKSSNIKVQGLDSLVSSENSIIRDKINSIFLQYDSWNLGEKESFKQLIGNIEETKIRMVLAEKEFIDLYINKMNRKDYYFDIEI
ncbi:MAG: hypothetical protein Q8O88_02675 [bacterium]|nr:hypothetical protein [bacterium]